VEESNGPNVDVGGRIEGEEKKMFGRTDPEDQGVTGISHLAGVAGSAGQTICSSAACSSWNRRPRWARLCDPGSDPLAPAFRLQIARFQHLQLATRCPRLGWLVAGHLPVPELPVLQS